MTLWSQASARKGYFLVSCIVFVLDQATKVAADTWLRFKAPVTIVPGLLGFACSRNRGGLFGYFSTLDDPWRFFLLTAFPAVAVVVIAVFLAKTDEPDRSTLFGLALILGGASGNLLDRVVRGEVVDFIDAYISWAPMERWLLEQFGTAHWPTFNIADSAIVVGACLLVLDVFRPAHRSDGSGSMEKPETAG